MHPDGHAPDAEAAEQAIGVAIQNLMAARLGRGFLPLAVLFGWGVVDLLRGVGGWVALGAVVTAGAMLAYGLRIVQRTLGRRSAWMGAAMVSSLAPPIYALYLVGWLGLRSLAPPDGGAAAVAALAHLGLGVWVLRCWMRVVELERLARVMLVDFDQEGGAV